MPRSYPQVLLEQRDRALLLVKYQWIAIALLTTIAVWTIVARHLECIRGASATATAVFSNLGKIGGYA